MKFTLNLGILYYTRYAKPGNHIPHPHPLPSLILSALSSGNWSGERDYPVLPGGDSNPGKLPRGDETKLSQEE